MATRGQRHARIHQWERDTDAYQSLCCEARALLVEFRLLYAGRENRIYLSTREIMRRLDVGRCKAEKARDELLDRGFVRLLKPGTFSQKTRNASEYALTNEAITLRDCNNAPKESMTCTPKNNSVFSFTSVGAAHHTTTHNSGSVWRPSRLPTIEKLPHEHFMLMRWLHAQTESQTQCPDASLRPMRRMWTMWRLYAGSARNHAYTRRGGA
ncbi:MAG: hypothetical protein P8014_00640 [Acidihalobacter sp.]|uniref:hypothetical protein n=1 Tax=Acidihalobacter sp. TaxID=1872108 RepID=UPI00307EE1CC